jgi:hypothetical protein
MWFNVANNIGIQNYFVPALLNYKWEGIDTERFIQYAKYQKRIYT